MQSIVVPLHVVPLQVSCKCSTVPTHVGPLPQSEPCAACSHMALAAQLPVLPQVICMHAPLGAGLPGRMLAQVPSGWPVNAMVQARQVPPHVLLQQTPITQCPV
jgi:hypothetical protein